MEFTNKVVAITGGSDGIGKALVEILLQKGAKVATCGRNHDKLYSLQQQFAGASLHTFVADVSNEDDCKRFISSTVTAFGGIDILINNAGTGTFGGFLDLDPETWEQQVKVNLFGVYYVTRAVLPDMIEAKAGDIINISSTWLRANWPTIGRSWT